MILKLAWRNLWRNKRRTFITMASIIFAVILAVAMRSFQLGTYDRMIENIVGSYSGYIQIHKAGYQDDQTIDNIMPLNDSLLTLLENHPEVTDVTPRLESFVLAASDEVTKGIAIIGTDPVKEDAMTGLSDKLTAGEYLKPDDDGILLGAGLAEFLELGVNDTIVLLGQGYHGVSAAGKYPVRGLVEFGSPELNKSAAYLPLSQAQVLFGASNMVSSVSINITDRDDMKPLAASLRNDLGEYYEVLDWEEILPELKQSIEGDSAGGVIMIAILYLIIGFGIFGTILMMLAEREYEFGILVSIGMKKLKLATTVVLETIIISMLGTLAGFVLSYPVVLYFMHRPIRFTGEFEEMYKSYGMEPIMITTNDPMIFVTQALIVLTLSLLLSLYPVVSLARLDPLKATRR